MSFGRTQHLFGLFFSLFQTYWTFVQQLEDGLLNQNTFAFLSWRIYEKLKKECLKYKWDLNELDWVISAL